MVAPSLFTLPPILPSRTLQPVRFPLRFAAFFPPSFLRRIARIPSLLYSARDAYVRERKQNLVADPATSTRNFPPPRLVRIIPGDRTKRNCAGDEREGGGERESSVHQLEIAVHPRGNRQVSLVYRQFDSQPMRIREFHPHIVGVMHDR